MTTRQARLVEAIAWRLRDNVHYRDLLHDAAREVGISQTEAVLVLDEIVDAEASRR